MTGDCSILSEEKVEMIVKADKYLKQEIDLANLPLSADGRYYLKKYDLDCKEYDCKMLIRQNTDRPTNFSVILVYKDPLLGEITLVRYNGNHGSHKNRLEKETIKGPHIHKITERYQLHTTHPDGFAIATDQYTDLGGAVKHFLEDMHIKDLRTKVHVTLEDF